MKTKPTNKCTQCKLDELVEFLKNYLEQRQVKAKLNIKTVTPVSKMKKVKQKAIIKRTSPKRTTRNGQDLKNRVYSAKRLSAALTEALAANVSDELKPVFQAIHVRDRIIARHFALLDKSAQRRCARGVVAHLKACEKNEMDADLLAIREIVMDARGGIFIFEDNLRERGIKRPVEVRSYFEVYK